MCVCVCVCGLHYTLRLNCCKDCVVAYTYSVQILDLTHTLCMQLQRARYLLKARFSFLDSGCHCCWPCLHINILYACILFMIAQRTTHSLHSAGGDSQFPSLSPLTFLMASSAPGGNIYVGSVRVHPTPLVVVVVVVVTLLLHLKAIKYKSI